MLPIRLQFVASMKRRPQENRCFAGSRPRWKTEVIVLGVRACSCESLPVIFLRTHPGESLGHQPVVKPVVEVFETGRDRKLFFVDPGRNRSERRRRLHRAQSFVIKHIRP